MEIKPINKALMPKFFAIAAAVAAAGTLTGCGKATEVAQTTGLVPVEADPTSTEEVRLDGDVAVESETETDEIIELAGNLDVTSDPSAVFETETDENVILDGDIDVICETDTSCETETEESLHAPGVFDPDDDPSAQHDTENAAEQNAIAADRARSAAESFRKAFAVCDITLVENSGYTFDSLQSVWSSTETPPRVVIYFFDGCGVHDGVKMKDILRNAFGEAEGLRVMDWGFAYDNETTYTAYIDISEVVLNDETAVRIAKELLNYEFDAASD